MRAISLLLVVCTALGCGAETPDDTWWDDGKGDGFGGDRTIEVVFTEPFCDVCTAADKTLLVERSPVTRKIVALVDGAQATIDIANFTFSVRAIEEAIIRARGRGVAVRVAMDAGQQMGDTAANRLLAAGVDVRFVAGSGTPVGLQHAKFMVVDKLSLATGSNNWSSTGTSINEESTIVIQSVDADPLLGGFRCHFEAIWAADHTAAGKCSTDEVFFAPSSAPIKMLEDELRHATRSIDVLMHHLAFDDLVKELAKAAERGVAVRVIVNATDRAEHTGPAWDRLIKAGGKLRYKQTNNDLFQLMHHKLAIVDDRVVVNGSGNWSGSAFFKNFENYVRYRDPRIARPYRDLYARLWMWSLTGESLDSGKTAARQHADETRVFFGNLHAHYAADAAGAALDDGKPIKTDASGAMVPVDVGPTPADAARFAFEYGRDEGAMDFLALTPHACDDAAAEAGDNANMIPEQFDQLRLVAADITKNSSGSFVAIAGMEWSTNSTGNHVNILGSKELAKLERGRFDQLYDEFLPGRELEGELPMVQFNHPRTFRNASNPSLEGNWDQVFDVSLRDIPNASDRARKFNDFGLDDYEPMKSELPKWIAGDAMPDRELVKQGLAAIERAARPYLRLTEVLVGRGTEISGESHENASLTTNFQTGVIERFTRVHSDWDYYLLNGFHTAPTAPHDNHFANWGTGHSTRTAIVAPALTEAALLGAIDQRLVYASEDEQLAIRMYTDGRVPMGGKLVTSATTATLELFLSDTDYTGTYDIVLWSGAIGGAAVTEVQRRDALAGGTWHTITVDLGSGEQFFYIEVTEPSPDRKAWTAPIWIERL